MLFDLDTLFFTTTFTSAVAGCLLLLTWLQSRDVEALALWGVGFLLAGAGLALIVARGTIPDFWSIVLGNAVLALGYGVGWLGVRRFERRRLSFPAAAAGAVVWLLACQLPMVVERPLARAAVMAAIVVAYTVLNAWEFYRARSNGLMSRWPLIAVLLGHAVIFLLRVPLAAMLADADTRHAWFVVFSLEAMLAVFCAAYLLGSLARERVVMDHKNASLIDPLTGVANRRAFFEQGERLLRRVLHGRRPAAVLVFDLDRFKMINDSFGHPAGDRVLISFCEIAMGVLRPGDLFARIGGEEFACLLPNAGRHGAVQVAERVRERLSVTPVTSGETSITATVSIGVAVSEGWSQDLAQLVTAADEALYLAKRNGRDRVEIAAARLVLVEGTPAGAAPTVGARGGVRPKMR